MVTAVLLRVTRVNSQTDTAEYKGSALCKVCHQETNKSIIESHLKSAHAKSLQKADAEGAIVADFSSNPVFKKEQVAYVLGKGNREQAFLDAKLQVLPAVWDVKSKSWKPTQAQDGATQCVGCHVTGYDTIEKKWVEAGVNCEACHGPGSVHLANPSAKDSIVRLKDLERDKQAMVCGQCHSKGTDPSGKFAHPIGFRPSDDLTKFFRDAKPTSHGRNQQYSEHITSKHYETIKMHCTTCHDPHGPVGANPYNLKQAINDQCLGCHAGTVKDMATHAPNAAPDATCASCHMEFGAHTFKKAENQSDK